MTVETWTQADLERLIGQEESSNLEFKRVAALDNTDGKKTEMVKDVVALANAAGGIIVYGLAEGPGGIATELEAGTGTDPLWVEQVLDSNIEPRLTGVIVKRIPLAEGRHAIAVEVPQSMTLAPHQSTRDHRYYRRHGQKVLAMLDHEVRDLMRRGSTPHLYFKYRLQHIAGNSFRAYVSLCNRSPEPAEYGTATLVFCDALGPPNAAANFKKLELGHQLEGGELLPATGFQRTFSLPNHLPIFREQDFLWLNLMLEVQPNSSSPISYQVACRGFTKTRFGFLSRANDLVAEINWNEPE